MSHDHSKKLEHALMELGVELFRLKNQVNAINEDNKKLVSALRGLQSILDERNLISKEDFEVAVSILTLAQTKSYLNQPEFEVDSPELMNKKNSH